MPLSGRGARARVCAQQVGERRWLGPRAAPRAGPFGVVTATCLTRPVATAGVGEGNVAGTEGNSVGAEGNVTGTEGNTVSTGGNAAGTEGNTAGAEGNVVGSEGNAVGT